MSVKIHSSETFVYVSHMLTSCLQLQGYCTLVHLRNDKLNIIPNFHNITVKPMSIRKSISITIQFDTLVFQNLGNKLFTGAKWQSRNATESGWTMCSSSFSWVYENDSYISWMYFQAFPVHYVKHWIKGDVGEENIGTNQKLLLHWLDNSRSL